MQAERIYAEDPLQQDWDDIAEKVIFAINNSIDATRKETSFYLVHDLLSRQCPRHFNEASDDSRTPWPGAGRRTRENSESQKHNESLSRTEKAAIPRTDQTVTPDDGPDETGRPKVRVKEKVQELAYELDLPDRSGYRFYPVMHVSRQKAADKFNNRPNTRVAEEVTDASQL
ncbi:LOW QUALITY PROTEIN: hypothetical protein PHMEG_00014300 [Phytophthora megakarya]|uniref:Reverse transcriptase n=1 Tax=Phytophthora megakarya TaxID=4795 RepID=A0A225W6Q5_9STRA|nr:LOW QUALITY PROTEIN: hypothetical protein PHMEG_00014300 [Phytophthora megakarya]